MTALCACLLGAPVVGCTGSTDSPEGRGDLVPTHSVPGWEAGAVASLAEVERAVRHRDPALLAASPARGSGTRGAPEQLRAVVGNAEALDVRDFELRYVGPAAGSSRVLRAGRAWSAQVEVSWRLARYDSRPSSVRMLAAFERRGSGARLVSLTSVPGGRLPVWLTGPVRARTSPRTLVLTARGQPVGDHARRARRALEVVGAVLPRWSGSLVVEVPRDESTLDAALGAAPGSYAGIAAVTAPVGDDGPATGPVHVLVNPSVLGRLGPRGAQVVLSHEAAHVATGGRRADRSPAWLREGFADYVALRDIDLPLRVTAAQVIDQVGRDGPPARLPGPGALAGDAPGLGASYEAAWLACRVLVRHAGQSALVALRRDVSGRRDLQGALRARTGWSTADLRAAWQARLRSLAAQAP